MMLGIWIDKSPDDPIRVPVIKKMVIRPNQWNEATLVFADGRLVRVVHKHNLIKRTLLRCNLLR